MGWSIWQSLKAREQAKRPPRPSVEAPVPPSMKVLLEIFAPAAPERKETAAAAVESSPTVHKEA